MSVLDLILKNRRPTLVAFAVLVTVLAHFFLLHLMIGENYSPQVPPIVVPIELHNTAAVSKFTAIKHATAKNSALKKPASVSSKPASLVDAGLTDSVSEVSPDSALFAPALKTITSAELMTESDVMLPSFSVIDTSPAFVTLPPPSASYLLDVVRTEPNVAHPYHGSGEIRWTHDDKSYKMHLEVGVDILFATIRLYSLDSEGTLGDTGIEPRSVKELRRTRSATTTYFDYAANTVRFSTNKPELALRVGAQDKGTVLMQLASIANAEPAQFSPGRVITIQVADETDANDYQFVVLDQETIDTKLGHLTTWHVVRPPRPGVYSSRLDIWFAPDLDWIPVQLRNTESNGAITTQTISKIIAGIKQ